jgi:hypothetical protein
VIVTNPFLLSGCRVVRLRGNTGYWMAGLDDSVHHVLVVEETPSHWAGRKITIDASEPKLIVVTDRGLSKYSPDRGYFWSKMLWEQVP